MRRGNCSKGRVRQPTADAAEGTHGFRSERAGQHLKRKVVVVRALAGLKLGVGPGSRCLSPRPRFRARPSLPAPAPPPFGPLGPRPGSQPDSRPARRSPLRTRPALRTCRRHHVPARQTEGNLQVWSALDRLRHELERAARQALSSGAGQLRGGVQQQGGPGRGSEPGWRGAGPLSSLSGQEPRPQDPFADLP